MSFNPFLSIWGRKSVLKATETARQVLLGPDCQKIYKKEPENVGVGVLIEKLSDANINPLIRGLFINDTDNKPLSAENNRLRRIRKNQKNIYPISKAKLEDIYANPLSFYLMVRTASINRHEWFPPSALIYNSDMPLSYAALRLTLNMMKNDKKKNSTNSNGFLLTSMNPCTELHIELPPDHPWKPNEEATMYTNNKDIIMNSDLVESHCWLTYADIMKQLRSEISMQLQPHLNE